MTAWQKHSPTRHAKETESAASTGPALYLSVYGAPEVADAVVVGAHPQHNPHRQVVQRPHRFDDVAVAGRCDAVRCGAWQCNGHVGHAGKTRSGNRHRRPEPMDIETYLGSPSVAMISATFCPFARSCAAMGATLAITSWMCRHSGVPPSGLASNACRI